MFPRISFSILLIFFICGAAASPAQPKAQAENAEAIVQRSLDALGGNKYLSVTSQIGKGRFSQIREGAVVSFQSFLDVIAFPDKERTEFKDGGSKVVQANSGEEGWVFDNGNEIIKIQTPAQIENFKRGMRVSIDNLLRGYWKGEAELSYVGRRPATLGRRNDVVKLTYKDGFSVEFEIGVADGIPVKAIYSRKNADGEEIVEEDRYAQFVDVGGVKTPFIIDRFTGGQQTARINFETIEFNKPIPPTIFVRPGSPKELKKDLKL